MKPEYREKLEKLVGNNALSRTFIQEMTVDYLIKKDIDSTINDFQKHMDFSDEFFSKKGYVLNENNTYMKQ